MLLGVIGAVPVFPSAPVLQVVPLLVFPLQVVSVTFEAAVIMVWGLKRFVSVVANELKLSIPFEVLGAIALMKYWVIELLKPKIGEMIDQAEVNENSHYDQLPKHLFNAVVFDLQDSSDGDDDNAEHEREVCYGERYRKAGLYKRRLKNAGVDIENNADKPCLNGNTNASYPRNDVSDQEAHA